MLLTDCIVHTIDERQARMLFNDFHRFTLGYNIPTTQKYY